MLTQYNLSSSPLLQGNEKIAKNYAEQNQTIRFTKLNSPIFPDRTELNRKELGLQALIDISSPFVIKH
jgi:hypothetical protein